MWQHLKSEWEYASVEIAGSVVVGVRYDAQSAESMRGETLEELSAVLKGPEPDLLAVLNILGEEGWEIAEKFEQSAGSVLLMLKRPGNRRAQKDAETRALMKRTLDEMGL